MNGCDSKINMGGGIHEGLSQDYYKILNIPVSNNNDTLSMEFRKECLDGRYIIKKHECPICSNTEFEIIGECDWINFTWGICLQCGLVQQYERLERRSLNRFYESGHYQAVCMNNLDDKMHFELERQVTSICFIDLIQKYCRTIGVSYNPSGKKILEIGCGSGGILYAFKQEGYNVEGYDLDEYRVNYGKQFVEELFCADALSNDVDYSGIDYILISNVLEHLDNPKDFLKELRKKISKDIVVIIDVPNFEYITEYSEKLDIVTFFNISHLWYFTPTTLERLLNECGFRIEYILGRGAAQSVVCKVSDKEKNEYNAYWGSKAVWEHAKIMCDRQSVMYVAKEKYNEVLRNK